MHEKITPLGSQEVTPQSLVPFLTKLGIPLELWGTGEAKTIEHLASELESGESQLLVVDSRVVRVCEGVTVNVRCIVDGVEWQLVSKQ